MHLSARIHKIAALVGAGRAMECWWCRSSRSSSSSSSKSSVQGPIINFQPTFAYVCEYMKLAVVSKGKG